MGLVLWRLTPCGVINCATLTEQFTHIQNYPNYRGDNVNMVVLEPVTNCCLKVCVINFPVKFHACVYSPYARTVTMRSSTPSYY